MQIVMLFNRLIQIFPINISFPCKAIPSISNKNRWLKTPWHHRDSAEQDGDKSGLLRRWDVPAVWTKYKGRLPFESVWMKMYAMGHQVSFLISFDMLRQ